jgi:hypothetical protein
MPARPGTERRAPRIYSGRWNYFWGLVFPFFFAHNKTERMGVQWH